MQIRINSRKRQNKKLPAYAGVHKINSDFLPPCWPIVCISIAGLLFSLLAFFPGWMSPDSIAQYEDAKTAVYHDWHPVIMAWWWRQLDQIYVGPALFLIQNLILYWGGWCLFGAASRCWFGKWAYLLPLFGFWPGLLYPLGQIWKDITFASTMFFMWGLLVNAYTQSRRLTLVEWGVTILLSLFAVGVKTNGIVVLPFVLFFAGYIDNVNKISWKKQLGIAFILTSVVVGGLMFLMSQLNIIKSFPFQYTQTYDLLAISVETNHNALPDYIVKRLSKSPLKLKEMYYYGGNDVLFYRETGNITTADPIELKDLNDRWLRNVIDHPRIYITHRLSNFKELLRIGSDKTAMVAFPGIVENAYGFQYKANKFADWMASQPEKHPGIFFPWIYLSVVAISFCALLFMKWHRVLIICMAGSVFSFTLPHIFIAPASDYRYLYYVYFYAMIMISFVILANVKLCIDKVVKLNSVK